MVWEITDELKEQTWAYFEAMPKRQRPHGLTDRRLARAKLMLWKDDTFWTDIIIRHGLDINGPEGLKEMDASGYDHLVGNFWGQVIGVLVEAGALK